MLIARQTFAVLHATADSNLSNDSNVRARHIAYACWLALVGI